MLYRQQQSEAKSSGSNQRKIRITFNRSSVREKNDLDALRCFLPTSLSETRRGVCCDFPRVSVLIYFHQICKHELIYEIWSLARCCSFFLSLSCSWEREEEEFNLAVVLRFQKGWKSDSKGSFYCVSCLFNNRCNMMKFPGFLFMFQFHITELFHLSLRG